MLSFSIMNLFAYIGILLTARFVYIKTRYWVGTKWRARKRYIEAQQELWFGLKRADMLDLRQVKSLRLHNRVECRAILLHPRGYDHPDTGYGMFDVYACKICPFTPRDKGESFATANIIGRYEDSEVLDIRLTRPDARIKIDFHPDSGAMRIYEHPGGDRPAYPLYLTPGLTTTITDEPPQVDQGK